MLPTLCATLLLTAASPVRENHTFPVEASYVALQNKHAAKIKKWDFSVGAITEAVPAEPATVEIVGHTFTAVGYDGVTPEPAFMAYARFVDDAYFITLSSQDIAGRMKISKTGQILESSITPELKAFLNELEPELQGLVNPTVMREGVQTEQVKQCIEAATISMEMTLAFVGTAIACGSLPYVCAGSVVATVLRTAWNIVKISDRTDKIAKMEREEEERQKKLGEKFNPGPLGPPLSDCPNGKSCPGMFEANPAGEYLAQITDWTSVAYWLDTDGDGEGDTCVVTAPHPKKPTPIGD